MGVAGFCIGWLAPNVVGEVVGHIEPLGVHPDFRHLGLGRAVLLECLRRLYRRGARHILVITDNYRGAALNLYELARLFFKEDCDATTPQVAGTSYHIIDWHKTDVQPGSLGCMRRCNPAAATDM